MNWKIPALTSAGLLSCATLLVAADTPPKQTATATNQVAPAPTSSLEAAVALRKAMKPRPERTTDKPRKVDVNVKTSTATCCPKLDAEYLILAHGYNNNNSGEFHLDISDDGVARENPPVGKPPFGVTEHVPCVIDCEPNEGEEICHDDYEDTYNAGCSADPPVFQPIACGDIICGTSGVFDFFGLTYRDMDWFEFTLDEMAIVTWAGEAEFFFAMWIAQGPCDNLVILDSANAPECTPISLTQVLGAGDYILIAAPADWGAYPCGVKYEASLTCGVVTGACCIQGECVATNERYQCDALGGEWFPTETCPEYDCRWLCPESTIDLMIMTDDWGYETSWEITDHYTGTLISSGSGYDNNTEYYECICIGYDDCVDFTIYDSYGDGIYAPGGYIIWLDGVEIANEMGGGFTGSIQTVESIGGGCVPDTGACCYNLGEDIRCVENHELECDALGGDWYLDEDCCTFHCPGWDCPESDVDITILTDAWPEETTWWITDHNTGVAICSGGPYADETLYYEQCCIAFSDCVDFTIYDAYGDGILAPGGYILTLDGFEIANTMGGGFTGSEDSVEMIGGGCMPCSGACCVELVCVATNSWADCDALGGVWYMCEECPDFTCPLEYCTPCYSDSDNDYITNVTFNTINNDTGPEGSPCSHGDYTDISTEVELEETYQLSVSLDGNDSWTQYVSVWFDWDVNSTLETVYQLGSVVITPGTPVTITGDITIPADAGFGVKRMRVMERHCQAAVDPCEVYPYGEAEDYWVVVTSGVCGDLDYDGDVDLDDYWIFLDAFGTCVGDGGYEEACDFDGDECITLVDYQMWMQCYRDANG